MIKVYIKVDNDNNITEITSSAFLFDPEGYICIDQGSGKDIDKYAHAQNYYLAKPILDENNNYNYKYINNKIIEN